MEIVAFSGSAPAISVSIHSGTGTVETPSRIRTDSTARRSGAISSDRTLYSQHFRNLIKAPY
ncbi:MAG: hypothetical protein MUC60_18075 [Oscillatoria sp. Prado101]|jgi:hypothetical protein|nr:hypothetical protein [Oscillatoria sp. Prado101]